MEDQDGQKELQLLPDPYNSLPSSSSSIMSSRPSDYSSSRYISSTVSDRNSSFHGQALDLQLSISLRPIQPPSDCILSGPSHCACVDGVKYSETSSCVDALKWQAAEQVRLAGIEKEYAERVRELTRREMELAQLEFGRARQLRERSREEVERAERMKERATRQIDSTCMEITCHSCRRRFQS